MLSTGVDIEDISRFKDKSQEFLERIFTSNEISYCFKNKNPLPHLAARFCAKEAVIKALSKRNIPYNKIEILKQPNGAPYINLLIDGYENYRFSLSISHEKDKAIAFVVVWSNIIL